MSPRRKKETSPTSKTEVLLHDQTVQETIAGLPRDLQNRMEDNVYIITKLSIRGNEDILRKYDAISDLVLHDIISPKKGDTIIKAISGAATAREKFLNVDWPERMAQEVEERIAKFKIAYFQAAQTMMDEKQYEGFRRRFDELTAQTK